MVPLFIIGLIAGLPVIAGLFFRVSAIFLFLSIAVGNLLVIYLGTEAGLVSGLVSKAEIAPLVAQLVLLFLPVGLSLVFLRGSLPRRLILIHLLPLLACGAMLVAVALPLLPAEVQSAVLSSPVGPYLRNSQGLIVGAAALLILMLTWLTGRSPGLNFDFLLKIWII